MYTHSVWVSDGDCVLPTGDYKNERTPDKLIKELKALGFKKVKTKSVVFGGNL